MEFVDVRGVPVAVRAEGDGRPLVLLHGASAHTPGRYTLEHVAADVAGLIQWLGEPAAVYGHSFGGHVGLALAATRPELVSALVVGDAPLSPEPLHAHVEADLHMTRRWRELAAARLSPRALAQELGALPVRLRPDEPAC